MLKYFISVIKFIFIIWILSSCQVSKVKSTAHRDNGNLKKVNKKILETGVASWYGPGFQGKKTANGETFDTQKFTAAHRTLPFGTILIVENQVNGKAVQVRVNDRGPFAKNRIIDLSKAAAGQLEMINAGTAKVKLYLVNKEENEIQLADIKNATYTVQVASFKEERLADQKAREISKGWIKKVNLNGESIYRVFYGKFLTTEEARQANSKLKKKGINGFVKQIEN